MTAEVDGKEHIIFSSDDMPDGDYYIGREAAVYYIHREAAEKLACEILEACQESHDADVIPPHQELTYNEWEAKGKPMEGNYKIISPNGNPKDAIVITTKCRKIVGYCP